MVSLFSFHSCEPNFDYPTDDSDYPEGGWHEEFDGEAFDDAWEYGNDADSNQVL
jgi:hypothetical protein